LFLSILILSQTQSEASNKLQFAFDLLQDGYKVEKKLTPTAPFVDLEMAEYTERIEHCLNEKQLSDLKKSREQRLEAEKQKLLQVKNK
jgi:hypothetical protein